METSNATKNFPSHNLYQKRNTTKKKKIGLQLLGNKHFQRLRNKSYPRFLLVIGDH